jgi:hypothetical protein
MLQLMCFRMIFLIGYSQESSQHSDWLQTGWPRGRSSSPIRGNFSLLRVVWTGSGAHPAYPIGTGGSSSSSQAARA